MNRAELQKKHDTIYCWLLRNNPKLLDQFFPKTKIISYYDILEKVKQCNTLKEFREKFNSYYVKACAKGWMNDFRLLLKPTKRPARFWSETRIIESALKYKTPRQWELGDKAAYSAATKLKILNKCTAHMIKQTLFYSKSECLDDALKFKTIKDWRLLGKCYASAYNKGKFFYKKCVAHMKRPPSSKCKSIKNLDTNEIFRCADDVHKKYKNTSKVNMVCNGQRKTAGGYRWAYCDEDGNEIKK